VAELLRIGGGVSAPSMLSKVEPEYSEEARKAKWQGSVVHSVIVDEFGHPKNIRVLRSLGLGLDQKAIEAVSQWRFKPGLKVSKPVPVIATIEVNFRLL
jgi:periplasmic protein TonB